MNPLTKWGQGPAVAGSVVVLLLAAYLIFGRSTGSKSIEQKWMFDLNTQVLVKADATLLAPADSASGPFSYGAFGEAGALVDAEIFSCGDPEAVSEGMTVEELSAVDAHLKTVSRMSPQAFKAAQEAAEGKVDLSGGGVGDSFLIGEVTGEKWFLSDSQPARELKAIARSSCDGKRGKRVYP